ncbi:MAG: zinc finger domain-containing protein, partial [Rhodocyclaceae bacterium]
HGWHSLPALADEAAVLARWQVLRAVKVEAQKVLEELRVAGKIGSSLAAEVEVRASGQRHELLAALGDDLRFVLIASKVTLVQVASADEEGVSAVATSHQKCGRCWHYRDDVGANAEHPELCGRCVSNLFGAGEARAWA